MRELEEVLARLAVVEAFMEAEQARNEKVDRLIDLLQKVENAMEIFIVIGNAFKWTIGLGAAFVAAYYGIRSMFKWQ